MSDELPLFAYANDSATALRDAALERVGEHNAGWLADAIALVPSVGRAIQPFTGEELRLALEAKLGLPNHRNVMGLVIRNCLRLQMIYPTGRYRHMRTSLSHARKTPEYGTRR